MSTARRSSMAVMMLVATVAVVVLAVAATRVFADAGPPPDATPDALDDDRSTTPATRSLPPTVDGVALREVSEHARPPEPVQWGLGDAPIPSNTWWASVVGGPGAIGLWPQPVAVTVRDGTVSIASPAREVLADGSVAAPLIPALMIDLGTRATTTVVDHGALHVRLDLTGEDGTRLGMTLVQGSPMIELDVSGPVDLRVPGLRLGATDGGGAQMDDVVRLGTAEGEWLLGSDGPLSLRADGDDLTVEPGRRRLVVGPVPAGADHTYDDAVRAVARHPVESTDERIMVDDVGATTQDLVVGRDDGADSLWALQPHHQRFLDADAVAFGSVPSAQGDAPVVALDTLPLSFPAVPVLWSAVVVPDSTPVAAGHRAPPSTDVAPGSYFAGKAALTAAAQTDAFRAAGEDADATETARQATSLLDALVDPGREPALRWDRRWGSVVVEPAEFGAGEQLNDHHLQYGYWVGAAAHLVEADPGLAARYREAIDLLVADYAGAATVPGAPRSLPRRRTWSPYEGHGWSSGTAPFEAGNNLESSSESSVAWWAAARWFLATDRPEIAEVFIGRLTIESALTGFHWLPDGPSLPERAAVRPWSGVVWSSKVDLATWFDGADESALGIRLLPLGPASMSRYGTPAAVDAAAARWDWCRDHGGGCTTRWANLLDSDAAVAGRPPIGGPDPEPSTTPLLSDWWRDLWTRTEMVPGWTCSPGAVVRRMHDGQVIVLASHPGPEPTTLVCRDADGVERWSAAVHGTTIGVIAAA